jgi:uncharacterized protein (DUF433 family)
MRTAPRLSGASLYKILTTPTYSLIESSQLVGITRWRVARWVHGYEYVYSVGKEQRAGRSASVIRHADEPQVSFLDLIDLLIVRRLLEKGFTLQYLRSALDEARTLLGTPHFARSTFYANTKQISLQLEHGSKYMITLMTGGQSVMAEVVEKLDDRIDFERVTGFNLASRWYPNGRTGLVVVDPQISFGRPTLVGHGVATENIYDLYLGESKRIKPVSEWFQIPGHEIRAAISFQNGLVGA